MVTSELSICPAKCCLRPSNCLFDLALHSVAERVEKKLLDRSRTFATGFYTFIAVLNRYNQAICDNKEIDIEALFKVEFNITPTKRMAIEESIWLKLARYWFSGDKEPDGKLKCTVDRLESIDKWFKKVLGPHILSAPTTSPEDFQTEIVGEGDVGGL